MPPQPSRPSAPKVAMGLEASFSRAALLVFWCLVLWGTLIFGAILWSLLTRGWAASESTLHPHGWEGWANLLLAPFALFVWGIVFFVIAQRSGPKPQSER